MVRRSALAATLVLSLSGGARAERVVEIVEVRHRVASEVVPALEAAGGVTVAADPNRNQLVLAGERADVAAAIALLQRLDVAPRTVVIRHEIRGEDDLSRKGLDVRWSAQAGDLRIGNVRRPRGTGVVLEPRSTRTRSRQDTTGSVRVLEGRTAVLRTGTTVPVRSRGPWGDTTFLIAADTGIEVRPTVLGDGSIQLEVFPFQGEVLPGGVVSSTSYSATVRLAPGESAVIGGFDRTVDARDAGTRRVSRDRGTERLVMLVSAEVVGEQAWPVEGPQPRAIE